LLTTLGHRIANSADASARAQYTMSRCWGAVFRDQASAIKDATINNKSRLFTRAVSSVCTSHLVRWHWGSARAAKLDGAQERLFANLAGLKRGTEHRQQFYRRIRRTLEGCKMARWSKSMADKQLKWIGHVARYPTLPAGRWLKLQRLQANYSEYWRIIGTLRGHDGACGTLKIMGQPIRTAESLRFTQCLDA
jgi:hypothetical protein